MTNLERAKKRYIGKEVGVFKILSVIEPDNKTYKGKVLCNVCGQTSTRRLTTSHLKSLGSCGCKGPSNKDYVGEISASLWNEIKSHKGRTSRQGMEFTITRQDAWKMFLKQERRCTYTGQRLSMPRKRESKGKYYKEGNASLDRIDSSKGYIPGNIQWVDKKINIMKNKLSEEWFLHLCKLVAGACEIL
jgi:hypothetical protein